MKPPVRVIEVPEARIRPHPLARVVVMVEQSTGIARPAVAAGLVFDFRDWFIHDDLPALTVAGSEPL